MNVRLSAFDRLRTLDAVFSVADVQVQLELDEKSASVYLNRWRAKGYVSRFGDGVYFNLLADTSATLRIPEAFDKLLRRPVLRVGPSILHEAGWTSQIHQRRDYAAAVFKGRLTLPRVEGDIGLTPRYLAWFEAMRATAEPVGPGEIPSVSPAMALADALLSRREFVARNRPVHAVPPDELDMDAFTRDRFDDVADALKALGATDDVAAELLAPYEAVVSEIQSSVQW